MDATEIDRIDAAIARYGDRFLRRVFTDGEIAYATRRRNPAPHFAGRFAAKEAAMKALGTGHSQGVLWRDIEVIRHGGPPQLKFHGGAAKRFAALNANSSLVDHHSLSNAGNRPGDAAPLVVIFRSPHARTSAAKSTRRDEILSAQHIGTTRSLPARRYRLCLRAGSRSCNMTVKIMPNDKGTPARKVSGSRDSLRRWLPSGLEACRASRCGSAAAVRDAT